MKKYRTYFYVNFISFIPPSIFTYNIVYAVCGHHKLNHQVLIGQYIEPESLPSIVLRSHSSFQYSTKKYEHSFHAITYLNKTIVVESPIYAYCAPNLPEHLRQHRHLLYRSGFSGIHLSQAVSQDGSEGSPMSSFGTFPYAVYG